MADTLATGGARTRASGAPTLIEAADLAGYLADRLRGYTALVNLLDLSCGAHLDNLSASDLAELLHRLNEGTQATATQLSDTLQALLDAGRASSPADEQEGGAL